MIDLKEEMVAAGVIRIDRNLEGPKDSWKKKNDRLNNKEITYGDGILTVIGDGNHRGENRERIDNELLLHRPVYRRVADRLDSGFWWSLYFILHWGS